MVVKSATLSGAAECEQWSSVAELHEKVINRASHPVELSK